MTIRDLETKTLGEVKRLLEEERISAELAAEYCQLWNTTTCRFTQARVMGGWTIMQFDKE